MKHPVKYAARETSPGRRRGYAILNPASGEFESHEAVQGGTCIPPVEFPLAEAQAHAAQMTQRAIGVPTAVRVAAARWSDDPGLDVPSVWGVEVAPNPCAHCGRKMFASDLDFCHPTNRERSAYVTACYEHNFGCGREVLGASYENAMARWNGQIP